MQRRHFLLLAAAVPPVIWLGGVGEVVLSERFILDRSGRCSFCNRSHLETRAMAGVLGLSVRICSECIALCQELIQEEGRRSAIAENTAARAASVARAAKTRVTSSQRDLEDAVRSDPNDFRSWLRLGDIHAKADRTDEAIACYLRVATSYERDGFYLKSVAVRKQILKMEPSRLDVRIELARTYRQLGLTDDAAREERIIAGLLGVDVSEQTTTAPLPRMAESLACSFCQKHQRDVGKLIAGPTVYICDGCVNVAADFVRSLGASTPS